MRDFFYILLIFLVGLVGCQNLKDKEEKKFLVIDQNNISKLIPINYDFINLKLYLNSSIDDSLVNIQWRWDPMNAQSGMPDSLGKDCYMNIDQKTFKFNNGVTLPSLFVRTERNKIRNFSVTTIFDLRDTTSTGVKEVLDELVKYDLLKIESVKSQLINDKCFHFDNVDYEEKLELEFSDTEYGYSNLTYTIKSK